MNFAKSIMIERECLTAAATAPIVSKSQTVLLLWGANCFYKLISMRRGQASKSLWPRLVLLSLYKAVSIGVHKGNTVCDFDTIWAVATAIIVQLDTLFLSYTLDFAIWPSNTKVLFVKMN